MKRIHLDELHDFSVRTMEACGMNRADARTVADVLVGTDSFGVMTHGTKNLYGYAQKMLAGGLDAKAQPTVERQGPAWAILNGNMAMGMVSASRAMELAIEKARNVGVAYVGVKNSCHFGAAGYYANLAAKAGMIGVVMSNADPIMAVPGGCGVSIGSNPFSYAAPTSDGKSVFLDIALSNVAALKVVMAKEKGEMLPPGCLVDREGRPTTDPNSFPGGSSLAPMAAHKGYGLAVMVEILSAVITGAGMLSQVKSWNLDMATPNNVGHAFIAIDVGQMTDMAEFEARMDALCRELRSAKRAEGTKQIFMPGEMEWAKRDKALAENAIELNDAMVANMEKLAEQFHLELNWAE
ncbi:MAG: Ldh family oxidoreductase [Aristaeellaceae bacterium]